MGWTEPKLIEIAEDGQLFVVLFPLEATIRTLVGHCLVRSAAAGSRLQAQTLQSLWVETSCPVAPALVIQAAPQEPSYLLASSGTSGSQSGDQLQLQFNMTLWFGMKKRLECVCVTV